MRAENNPRVFQNNVFFGMQHNTFQRSSMQVFRAHAYLPSIGFGCLCQRQKGKSEFAKIPPRDFLYLSLAQGRKYEKPCVKTCLWLKTSGQQRRTPVLFIKQTASENLATHSQSNSNSNTGNLLITNTISFMRRCWTQRISQLGHFRSPSFLFYLLSG